MEEDYLIFYRNCGYSKPAAKSMVLLHEIIEYAEGHPGKGSLFPWHVRFTKEAAKELGLGCRFISRVTELHNVAEKYVDYKFKKLIENQKGGKNGCEESEQAKGDSR